jgi:hypothetical protein
MHFKSTRALQRILLILAVPVWAVGGMIVDMSVSFSVFRTLLTLRAVWGCNPWMCFNHCGTQLQARGRQAGILANTLMGLGLVANVCFFSVYQQPPHIYQCLASSVCMCVCYVVPRLYVCT